MTSLFILVVFLTANLLTKVVIYVIHCAGMFSPSGRMEKSAAWTLSWRMSRVLLLSCRRKSKNCR